MQSLNFTHFLITRFNLKFPIWQTSRDGAPVLTEEWLKNRFRIFENFCFPSVKGQVNQKFQWLVFFDKKTPAVYKKNIEGFQNDFAPFMPIFADNMSQFLPEIQKRIRKSPTPFVITSRLDNDDCLGKYYVEEVQNQFKGQNFLALDTPMGYTLQIKPTVKVGKRKQAYNPFMSLIERNENPQSIWSKEKHGSWKREKRVKRLSENCLWLSVIHGENKKNDFDGYGDVNWEKIRSHFKIEKEKATSLKNQLVPFSSWRLQSFSNRVQSNWKLGSKDFKRKIGFYK